MIGYLEGTILQTYTTHLIVLVGGVGYTVYVPLPLLESYEKGSSASLYITSVIKEDVFDLYGFKTNNEKNLFDLIISVSGIGPKTALGVLSQFSMDDIVTAVREGNAGFFTGVPRLGKKNATKLILELQSKIGDGGGEDLLLDDIRDTELVSALHQLGFSDKEINPVLAHVHATDGTIEEKITIALKYLGKSA